jgi:hypothetical protein
MRREFAKRRSGRTRSPRKGGWIAVRPGKTKKSSGVSVEIPVLPILQETIDARPTGNLTFLVTEFGKPFTVNGLGNKMRQWCKSGWFAAVLDPLFAQGRGGDRGRERRDRRRASGDLRVGHEAADSLVYEGCKPSPNCRERDPQAHSKQMST